MLIWEDDANLLTGTYDDIVLFLVRAEAARRKAAPLPGPLKKIGEHPIIEPFFNLIGIAMGWVFRLCPASIALRVQDRLWRHLAQPVWFPFDGDSPPLIEARRQCEMVKNKTGKPPAILCLTSHAPISEGTLLNIEMGRHVLQALQHLRVGKLTRPRFLVAVDPFALDMLSAPQEAMYAGFMGTYHVGLDRMTHVRRFLSRKLLASTSVNLVPWRLASILSGRGELGMVLAGGFPENSRALYSVREYLIRLRRQRNGGTSPAQILKGMFQNNADFKRFFAQGPVGGNLRRSVWKMTEAWIIARMAGQWPPGSGDTSVADQGMLTADFEGCLWSFAKELGYSKAEFQETISVFKEEFARETPYRERFFRFLAGRVVGKGTPLLLLPFMHRETTSEKTSKKEMKLIWENPILWTGLERDSVIFTRSGGKQESIPIDRFVRDFVQTNYF